MATHTHTLPHPAAHHRETGLIARLFRAALNRFLGAAVTIWVAWTCTVGRIAPSARNSAAP